MERGLLWLPLLVVFFALVWLGRNEFRKVQAYGEWAKAFDQAKYDIYAVLGQKGQDLTWGKPTSQGPVNLSTFSLTQVTAIRLVPDSKPIVIQFDLPGVGESIKIPFTQVALAQKWTDYLEKVRSGGNGHPVG